MTNTNTTPNVEALLAEATQQYAEYLRLLEVTQIGTPGLCGQDEYSHRDLNHPLEVVVHTGLRNALLESAA